MLILLVIILAGLLILTYLGYRLYDSKKVPEDTPDLVADVRNKITKKKSKK